MENRRDGYFAHSLTLDKMIVYEDIINNLNGNLHFNRNAYQNLLNKCMGYLTNKEIWPYHIVFSIENVTINDTKDINKRISEKIRNESNLRIVFLSGRNADTDKFYNSNASHIALIIIDPGQTFHVEKHKVSHIFYQFIPTVELAELFINGVILDSTLCHLLGLCEIAQRTIDRQKISHEKVEFLKSANLLELLEKYDVNENHIKTIEAFANNLNNDTPYISFLMIFSDYLLSQNIESIRTRREQESDVLHSYVCLWKVFRQWYFDKHHRSIKKTYTLDDIRSLINSIHKYYGQIGDKGLEKEIRGIITKQEKNPPQLGVGRYYLVILRHTPKKELVIKQIQSIMGGIVLYQNKSVVKRKEDLDQFSNYEQLVYFYFEVE